VAGIAGLLAAITAALFWVQRFQPSPVAWPFILVLALAAGVGVGALLYRARLGRSVPFRVLGALSLALFLVAVLALLVTAARRASPSDDPQRSGQAVSGQQPNIVLVTASGVRPDHLGVYGYDSEISPNLDALARRGTRFGEAFAQASWSEPSMASLLTSLYPSELGPSCWATIRCQPHLDSERVTLAEALSGAGYRTQAYLTSPWLTEELGFAQGFDGFESVRAEEPFDLAPTRARMLGRLLGCARDSAACRLLSQGHARLFDTPIPTGWGGGLVNARVARFLQLHGGELFFLWVHYTEALPPYDLEPPFRPLRDDPQASPQRLLKKLGYWELGDPFTWREVLLPGDEEGLAALYDGELHRLDGLVGELVGLLEAKGLTGQTLVVFTSDHGQEFAEHGGYTYGHSLYDEVLRVPLFVAGMGAGSAGGVVETPVSLLDLAPTLLEIGGASIPAEAEGRSLLPALQGGALAERPVYSESLYRVPVELKAMRSGGYKLIYDADRGEMEIYDLTADPGEQTNLAAGAPQVAEVMRQALLEWIAHTEQVFRDLPRLAPPRQVRDPVW